MKKLLRYRLALGAAVCWAMTDNIVQADYVGTLNTIAGANKVSYWNLNEAAGTTAADAWTTGTLDNNNTGTYSGIGVSGVTVGAAGPRPTDGLLGFSPSNNATSFGGSTDQLLRMANSASFNSVTSLTMTIWFNFPNGQTGERYFGGLSDDTTNATGRYAFAFNSNANPSLRSYFRLQNGSQPILSNELDYSITPSGLSDTFRDGNWHMATLTMADSGLDKVFNTFVDGNLLNTGTITNGGGKHLADRHTNNAATAALAFGNDLGATVRGFIGRLDEISFINRALSVAEVDQLWDSAFAAPTEDGDFNNDGFVDSADYVVWRKTLGDPANYDLWRSTFGSASGAGAGLTSEAGAVPEPATVGMLFCVGVGVLSGWPRRLRRSAK